MKLYPLLLQILLKQIIEITPVNLFMFQFDLLTFWRCGNTMDKQLNTIVIIMYLTLLLNNIIPTQVLCFGLFHSI